MKKVPKIPKSITNCNINTRVIDYSTFFKNRFRIIREIKILKKPVAILKIQKKTVNRFYEITIQNKYKKLQISQEW